MCVYCIYMYMCNIEGYSTSALENSSTQRDIACSIYNSCYIPVC